MLLKNYKILLILGCLLVVSYKEQCEIKYYGHFQKEKELPKKINKNTSGNYFIDFGKDAFCQINFLFTSDNDNDSVEVWLGEQAVNDSIIKKPIGTKIAERFILHLKKGTNEYSLNINKKKNYSSASIVMPDSIGEVLPFRYCEIKNYHKKIKNKDIKRFVVSNIFNEDDSYFESSDTILNQVYKLCKHTMKATSFCGYFVDGNRERIPYEGDILINQLSWFCVSKDCSISKRTLRHIIENPTWPTEYIMQTLIIAWQYYLYSGDQSIFTEYYENLKNKTLYMLRDKNGLIPTGDGIRDSMVLKSVCFKGDFIRDMVDWPKCGDFDWGENSNIIDTTDFGEDDFFIYQKYNTVENCFHYKACSLLSKIAQILGNNKDKQLFEEYAFKTKESINKYLINNNIYKDGKDTDHKSLHSNMTALYCNVVEEHNLERVVNYIKSKGMVCSVYGSQFLLDALCNHNQEDYALQLLIKTDKRSWYNMIRTGSTLTTEAWDDCYKPNQDWNHAWGAAPINIITRKIIGIEPQEPGFKRIKIKPSPYLPDYVTIKVPTIVGDIFFTHKRKNRNHIITIKVPITSEIQLPNGYMEIVNAGWYNFEYSI